MCVYHVTFHSQNMEAWEVALVKADPMFSHMREGILNTVYALLTQQLKTNAITYLCNPIIHFPLAPHSHLH